MSEAVEVTAGAVTSIEARGRSGRLPQMGALGLAGGVVFVLIMAATLVGPWIWTLSPTAQDLSGALSGPSNAHPLGQDGFGRDELSRLLHGGRVTLAIGIGSALIALVIGAVLGSVAAARSGWISTVILRATDALLALPLIVLAILLVAAIGFGEFPMLVALAIGATPVVLRVAYATALVIFQQDYISVSRGAGVPLPNIIITHVIPNMSSALLPLVAFRAAQNMVIAAGLNYFGIGVQPPEAEWGLMIAEAQKYMDLNWGLIALPGLCILLVGVSLNLLSDGLRDWLDPRSLKIGGRI